MPEAEKYYYRNEEKFQKELSDKKATIDKLEREKENLQKEMRELKTKSQEQGRVIISQQKDLHEKEINQKKQTVSLEELIADLKTEKEEEEYRLSSQITNLTEQLEKG